VLVSGAALMQFLESEQNLPYHTWTYFMTVTICTVGYGEIVAISAVGRVAVMAIIGFAVVQVPMMTGDLIEKLMTQSVFARAYYTPKNDGSRHVLICGDLKSTALNEFFDELFHEDHADQDIHAVILQNGKTKQILFVLHNRLVAAVCK
jgi:hypothetical protein